MVHLYPLKSINRPLEPGLRAPGPLVQASIEITDEAGTISSAWPQRNPTYRPSSLNNMYNAPPPSHRLYTRTASKMALAEHHLQLDTLPSLPFHYGRQWANTELASALFVAVYATAAWMVWYGIVAIVIIIIINLTNLHRVTSGLQL